LNKFFSWLEVVEALALMQRLFMFVEAVVQLTSLEDVEALTKWQRLVSFVEAVFKLTSF
jgi:hypothetical protein